MGFGKPAGRPSRVRTRSARPRASATGCVAACTDKRDHTPPRGAIAYRGAFSARCEPRCGVAVSRWRDASSIFVCLVMR